MKEMVISFFYLLRHILRLVINCNIFFYEKYNNKKSENIHILANGPSLNEDLSNNFEEIKNGDILVVNGFANSDLYVELKPSYYVLIDPLYWDDTISNSDMDYERMVLSKIVSETDWDLSLFVPAKGYKHIEYIFRDNTKIKIIRFNDFVLQTKWQKINFSFYKANLACPNLQNVLVASIFLAVNLGCRKISLSGTDHSWIKNITLNSKNEVCIKHDHFYDSEENLVPWMSNSGSIYKMHEILSDLATIFRGYYELSKYANVCNVEIINFTKGSYIDAFKKAL